jgi:hypothetical protein
LYIGIISSSVSEERVSEDRARESVNEPQEDRPEARSGEDEPMLYCPVCSTRLTEMKFKLLCTKCGYYMSCADYY